MPSIFSDRMVLQQELPIRVFGWADKGEQVTVTLNGQTATAKADDDGQWRVALPAMKADGKEYTLSIKGHNSIELKNVLLGEVWICSGQSNMEWPLQASLNAPQEIAAADYPQIRLFNVPGHIAVDTPADNTPGNWQHCSPKSVAGYSAVGYFFGRKLFKEIDVPIGLIGTNWGGTRIEPWTPPVGFDAVPALKNFSDFIKQLDSTTPEGKAYHSDYLDTVEAWVKASRKAVAADKPIANPPAMPSLNNIHGATRIYNGMVHGLAPFSVRGAIWYQGESNAGDGEGYAAKKEALVKGWRTVFENEDLSFYWVQLANFQQPTDNPAGGGWGPVREGQRKALTVPNTGMAVIIDIGAANDIHPRNKQDVGARLARWALAKDYGKSDVVYSGPLYKEMKVEGNAIRIAFDHVGGGLMIGEKDGLATTTEVKDGKLNRFAIAGADKVWHWADAKVDGDTVVVSSDAVKEPVAVRFGYESNPVGINLYNKAGLPASPFRTDNW